jgi:hypothetical protein
VEICVQSIDATILSSAEFNGLQSITIDQVLTDDQIITPEGHEIQSVQDSHAMLSDTNNQPEAIYVQPIGSSILSSIEHHEHAFGG